MHTFKCLNPRQARWSLLLNRFNFTLAYRPSPKNTRPDALSCLHSPSQISDEPSNILPFRTLVTAAHLNIVAKVEEPLKASISPASTPSACRLSQMRSAPRFLIGRMCPDCPATPGFVALSPSWSDASGGLQFAVMWSLSLHALCVPAPRAAINNRKAFYNLSQFSSQSTLVSHLPGFRHGFRNPFLKQDIMDLHLIPLLNGPPQLPLRPYEVRSIVRAYLTNLTSPGSEASERIDKRVGVQR